MDFFFNELSYGSTDTDIHAGRQRMATLLATLRRLRSLTRSLPQTPSLRAPVDFSCAVLCEGYNLAQWRGDPAVDPTERLFFKTLATKTPYLDELPREVSTEFPEVYLYRHAGAESVGLGYAHLLSGLGVSFHDRAHWDENSVTLEATYLTEDSEDTFQVTVPHAARPEHADALQAWLGDRVRTEVGAPATLSELWEKRASLFPSLAFCPEVESNFVDLDARQHLPGILSALRSYERYTQQWRASGKSFDHNALLHVTPESASRIRDHRKALSFDWRGQSRLFSLHGRFTPGPGRIHIWPDLVAQTIVIGYIGRKIGL